MLVSLLAVALGLVTHVSAQEVSCYAPDGSVANNETYVPCNKLGITQSGVFSSCCALDGPADERDICSSSGLCINKQQQPQRGFCTDKTWKSKACVNICMDEAVRSQGFGELTDVLTLDSLAVPLPTQLSLPLVMTAQPSIAAEHRTQPAVAQMKRSQSRLRNQSALRTPQMAMALATMMLSREPLSVSLL